MAETSILEKKIGSGESVSQFWKPLI
jgi:hypothetical protein